MTGPRKHRKRPPRPPARPLRADRLEDRLAPAVIPADRGATPDVIVTDDTGAASFRVAAFPPEFSGGVWVASADVTGDGTPDLIAAPGPGSPPLVRIFDGTTGELVASFLAYEAGFTGGVYVAAADLNGDGKAEIVTGTDTGGGPRVRVFDGAAAPSRPVVLADFLAIDDPNFRGGVRVALGDINGDGVADLVAAAGIGGGPRVSGFDGRALGRGAAQSLFPDFFAFEPGVRNGAYVAAGDVTGDGVADLVFGGGPGGGPRVRVIDGGALLAAGAVGSLDDRPDLAVGNFFVGDVNDRDGVRVGVWDSPSGPGILAVGMVTGPDTVPVLDPRTGAVVRTLPRDVAVNGGLFNQTARAASPPAAPVPVTPPPAAPPPPVTPSPPPPSTNTAPSISPFAAQTVAAGVAFGPVAFTVADAETPAAALVVTVASSDPAVVAAAGLRLGGTGATRTLTITGATAGTATVTVTVTDAGGRTAAAGFPLTVAPPPLAAPTALTAAAVSPTRIDLAWTDWSTGETGFVVERAADAAFTREAVALPVGPNAAAFATDGLTPGRTYYFRVRAARGAVVSDPSNVAAAATPSPPPPDVARPTVTLVSPTGPVTARGEVGFSGFVSDDRLGATLAVSLDGGPFAPVPLDASGAFLHRVSFPAGTDGLHTVTFRAADAAGNPSDGVTVGVTLDTTPPPVVLQLAAASDTPPAGNGVTTLDTVTLTGTTEPGRAVTLAWAVPPAAAPDRTTVAASDGTFAFPGVPLAAGRNEFTATAFDAAGNAGAATLVVTRVADPEQPPTATPALAPEAFAGPGLTADRTPDVVVDADPGDRVEVLVDGVAVATAVVPGGGTGVRVTLPELADGTHAVAARRVTADGRTGTVSAAFTFRVDASAPTAASLSLAVADRAGGPLVTAAARVTLTGGTEPGTLVTLTGTGRTALAGGNGVYEFPDVPLAVGANTFAVTVTDEAGNRATFPAVTVTRTDPAASTDAVLAWTNVTLAAVRASAADPLAASRAFGMVFGAVADAVSAVEGRAGLFVTLPPRPTASAEAAVAAAAYGVLADLFPSQSGPLLAALAASMAAVPDGAAKTDGAAVGAAVAAAVLAQRRHDGSDRFETYSTTGQPGEWVPTPGRYAPALAPQWATVTPFVLARPDQARPGPPPAVSSAAYAADLTEVTQLGRADSVLRTAEQTEIARFWDGAPGTDTAAGRWVAVAATVAAAQGNGLSANARLMGMLGLALADAGIAAADANAAYGTWRPVTAARAADGTWLPLLDTPSTPDAASLHSAFASAAAEVLTAAFGDGVGFATGSDGLPGVTRSFASFRDAAAEAGRSRVLAGTDFEFANRAGADAGKAVAARVLAAFDRAADTVPPRITPEPAPGAAFAAVPTVTGRVADNLIGLASFTVQLDGGAPVPVAVDAQGNWSFTPQLASDGTADGNHSLTFHATDALGNASPAVVLPFVLAARGPALAVTATALRLTGTVTGPAAVVALTYRIDGGPATPVPFAAGAFDHALDLSLVTAGSHTVTVQATDAAGNVATATRTVIVAAPTLLVTEVSPASGSAGVGVAARPEVRFSRPVDPATLTAAAVSATAPDGRVLPATVVPSADGTRAWLFFADPLPGNALVTVTVRGDQITAADGTRLDADGDGTPGGFLAFAFTTAAADPVPGTTLTGVVLDPGPDGVPNTPDDGAPLAGVAVSVAGRPDLSATTDAQGRFALAGLPGGAVRLVLGGGTATNAPTGVRFPTAAFDLSLVPGRANTVAGTTGTAEERAAGQGVEAVFLPRLAGPPTTVTAGSGPVAVSGGGVTVTLDPDALVGADARPVSSAAVTVGVVPAGLTRQQWPAGALRSALTVVIDAPGVSAFTAPAQVTFPNVFSAAPGTQLLVLGFDPATGQATPVGTATVSADGRTVTTDRGSGPMAPGLIGLAPPGTFATGGAPTTGPGSPPAAASPPPSGGPGAPPPGSGGGSSVGTPQSPDAAGAVSVAPVPQFEGVQNYLFVDDAGAFTVTMRNAAARLDPAADPLAPANARVTAMRVTLRVDGPAGEFLDGLPASVARFALLPGQEKRLQIQVKDLIPTIRALAADRLYGARVRIVAAADDAPDTPLYDQTFYVYRFLDVADANHADGVAEFADTANDGPSGVTRVRPLEVKAGAAAAPGFAVADDANFGASAAGFTFDPRATGENLSTAVTVRTPGGAAVGTIGLRGDATLQEWYVDQAKFRAVLSAVAIGGIPGATADERALIDTPAKRQLLIDAVLEQAEALLQPFAAGWVRVTSPSPAAVSVTTFSSTGDPFVITDGDQTGTPGPGGSTSPPVPAGLLGNAFLVDNGNVADLLAKRALYGAPEQAFRLAEALNEQPAGRVDVYVDRFFGQQDFAALGLEALANALAKTIVHEIGHHLGLNHTDANGSTVGGPDAADDIMSQGMDTDGSRRFLLTANAARVALGLGWTLDQTRQAVDYFAAYAAAGGHFDEDHGHHDGDESGGTSPPPGLPLGAGAGAVVTPAGQPADAAAFGAVVLNGPAAGQDLTVVNIGDRPLTLTGARLTGAGFRLVTAVPAGTVLAPGGTLTVRVEFAPSAAGPAAGQLVFDTDGLVPAVPVSLTGFGRVTGPSLRADLGGTSNLGGVAVGEAATTTVTLTNQGDTPLTVTGADAEGDVAVIGLAPNAVLQPGESLTVTASFAPTGYGVRGGAVRFLTDAAAAVRVPLTGTGLAADGGGAKWGSDVVAVAVGGGPATRFRSDAAGAFHVYLPPQTAYTLTVYDPETGLIWATTGVSAAAGLATDFGFPDFAPSAAADADGNGVPDDIDAAVGPGRFFDFGPADAPTAAGYTPVTGGDRFDADAAFGWVSPVAVDRDAVANNGRTTALTGDARETPDATFAVRLPDGVYDVTVWLAARPAGDAAVVSLQGTAVGTVAPSADRAASPTYRAEVTGGVLTVRVAGQTGGTVAVAGLDVVRVGDVGTPASPPSGGPYLYAVENLRTGDVLRGTAAGPTLHPGGLFLAPDADYREWVFDPATGQVGASTFRTGPSGTAARLPSVPLAADGSPDSDGDGRSDRAEFIAGTDPNRANG